MILIDLHDVFRSDLLTSFIKCGICSALADWLQPLPDHSLPHMKIREGILDALGTVSITTLPNLPIGKLPHTHTHTHFTHFFR